METSLQFPLKSLGKTEINVEIENWLNAAMERYPAEELFVMLKQCEYAIEHAVGITKFAAYQAAGERFKGVAKGDILGHEVKLVASTEWVYSADLESFKERQKKELKIEQLKEQSSGVAKKIEKENQIRISLKE